MLQNCAAKKKPQPMTFRWVQGVGEGVGSKDEEREPMDERDVGTHPPASPVGRSLF